MSFNLPVRHELRTLLIAFTDLEGYSQITHKLRDPIQAFQLPDNVARIIAAAIQAAGGYYVKTMGDGALMVFDATDCDAGLDALLAAKSAVEAYLQQQGFSNRLRVTAHVGTAVIGPAEPYGQLDVYGEEVNRAALVGAGSYRSELVLSPETFRKLSPAMRKKFKRHIRETVYRFSS
ncbi:MAG: hypothetical protein A2087_07875 [Spirochaetes bacterium GWD1_61_31]|nr:MAG: hypothetical protein A2Y37_07600 [Spirochaetes bacterium GWB1_60_80]OHD34320.1 MAG: hypothetical protein A2004_13155 [Spirochaetes bacterium GWC1_61_12]OHD40249.1 MAG: hypothetical protein A2087_07875 [Spirochaetes bacterium GWD1_61_31]OHD45704.1 MAG: hypothetical protein A2Y35_03235 [Spirochaetes bacterium GWE1_60_18]OHD59895.1 MAG: hypothetical protein A2Y32_00155 [Spirochaetes bacterium GWF1_60_12]HBO41962.1 hypothetical protein [Spirochaetaceae bacterium]